MGGGETGNNMKSKYSEIEGLIEQIQKIAFDKPREQTFLEVCRCSERENVYSDILKFFFDSDEEHNFRNLFIRSLLTLLNQEKVDEYTKLVEREDTTSDNTRLDIVIETESFIIGIENKINHLPINPFDSYSKHLESKNVGDKKVLKVILCLNDKKRTGEHGFQVITYKSLIKEIKKNQKEHISTENQRYKFMIDDFVETVENLYRGRIMNNEFLDLLRKNEKPLTQAWIEINNIRDELREKVQKLGELIQIDKKYAKSVNQFCYREKDGLWDYLVHTIKTNDSKTFVIDTYLDVDGWEICAKYRKGTNLLKLKEILDSWGISSEINNEHKMLVCKKYGYPESLGEIAKHLQNILDKTLKGLYDSNSLA